MLLLSSRHAFRIDGSLNYKFIIIVTQQQAATDAIYTIESKRSHLIPTQFEYPQLINDQALYIISPRNPSVLLSVAFFVARWLFMELPAINSRRPYFQTSGCLRASPLPSKPSSCQRPKRTYWKWGENYKWREV